MNRTDVFSSPATTGQFLLNRETDYTHLTTRFAEGTNDLNYNDGLIDEMNCFNQANFQNEAPFYENRHNASLISYSQQYADGCTYPGSETNSQILSPLNSTANNFNYQGPENFYSTRVENFCSVPNDFNANVHGQLSFNFAVINDNIDYNSGIENESGLLTLNTPNEIYCNRQAIAQTAPTPCYPETHQTSFNQAALATEVGGSSCRTPFNFNECRSMEQQCYYQEEQRIYRPKQTFSANSCAYSDLEQVRELPLSSQRPNPLRTEDAPGPVDDDLDDVFLDIPTQQNVFLPFNPSNSRHASTPGLTCKVKSCSNILPLIEYPPKTHSNPAAPFDIDSFNKKQNLGKIGTADAGRSNSSSVTKKDMQRIRNNKACKKFREKKKRHLQETEAEHCSLLEENSRLKAKVSKLENEITNVLSLLPKNVVNGIRR